MFWAHLAGGPNLPFEMQLRLSASGNTLSAIWMETFNNITSRFAARHGGKLK